MMGKEWRVVGFDTFAHETYSLGWYATREEAMAKARQQLAHIQEHQPRETAGQLQDDVGVVDPEGNSVPIDPE